MKGMMYYRKEDDLLQDDTGVEVDLRFSLKDICALAGVSHQSIRMYEKWGVLPKIAESENGYRYYHYPDLQRVIFLRYYASTGVPIKASASLINGASVDRMQEVLLAQEQMLEQQLLFQQAALACMKRQRRLLKEIDQFQDACRVEMRPAMYRLRCMEGGRISEDAGARQLMKEWAGLFPVTMFSGICDAQQRSVDGIVEPGYAIGAEYAHLLTTTQSAYVEYYPPVRAVRSIQRISSTARDFTSMGCFTQAYIAQNGYRAVGKIVSISIANKALTQTCPEDPSDYVCSWTPIE